jgi:hypothetical protein
MPSRSEGPSKNLPEASRFFSPTAGEILISKSIPRRLGRPQRETDRNKYESEGELFSYLLEIFSYLYGPHVPARGGTERAIQLRTKSSASPKPSDDEFGLDVVIQVGTGNGVAPDFTNTCQHPRAEYRG